jgi:hypothetical protein
MPKVRKFRAVSLIIAAAMFGLAWTASGATASINPMNQSWLPSTKQLKKSRAFSKALPVPYGLRSLDTSHWAELPEIGVEPVFLPVGQQFAQATGEQRRKYFNCFVNCYKYAAQCMERQKSAVGRSAHARERLCFNRHLSPHGSTSCIRRCGGCGCKTCSRVNTSLACTGKQPQPRRGSLPGTALDRARPSCKGMRQLKPGCCKYGIRPQCAGLKSFGHVCCLSNPR